MSNKLTLLPEILQLPIVFLIIVSCKYFTSVLSEFKKNDESLIEGIKNNPLTFASFAFIINFFYITLHIIISYFSLTYFNDSLLETLLDTCTAFLFTLAFSSLFFDTNKIIIYTKDDAYYTLLLIYLIILIANDTIVFNIYNALSYILCGYYIYKQLNRIRCFHSNNKFRGTILLGFGIWGFLQFLPTDNDNSNFYKVLGFSISLFSKLLIFFGFYIFILNYIKTIFFVKDTENSELRFSSSKFQELNKIINKIAVSDENGKVISIMIDDLVNSEIFKFDYAIFSRVDNVQGKILHDRKHAFAKEESNIFRVSEWVREGGINIGHHDVMSQVVLNKKPVYVKNDFVNGIKVDFNKNKPLLDKEIYTEFNHSTLDRLFIPVSNYDIFSTDENSFNENIKVIGVLELGYNMLSEHYSNGIENINKGLLNIYLNNIAQTYIGNQFKEEGEVINSLIEEFSKENTAFREMHITFINKVFNKCAEEIGADQGDLSFLSLDNLQMTQNAFTYGDLTIQALKNVRNNNFNLPPEKRRKGIFNYVAESKEAYIAKNVLTDRYYIPGLPNPGSQLSIPFKFNETVIGIVSFYSSKIDFFNKDKEKYAQRFFDLAISTFLRLKLSYAVESLVTPYSIYDKKAILSATCERLSKYFTSNYISIWESNISNPHDFYLTHSNDNNIVDYFKKVLINNFKYNSTEPFIISRGINDNDLNNIEEYAFNYDFESIIYIPMEGYKGKNRFITIFSKRYIVNIFPEDKTFFSHITNKFLLSINFFEVYNFFDQLTKETYKRDIHEILNDFVKYSQEISGADLILIFIYDNNQSENKFVDVINPLGNFKDKRIEERFDLKEINKNDFSYSIIDNGSQWIENETQYRAYREKQTNWKGWGVFEQDFWYREEIKSLAAIRIEFNDEVQGVMFYNFLNYQEFNIYSEDKVKQKKAFDNISLINLLSNLIGRIIKISQTLSNDRNRLIKNANDSQLIARSEVAMGMIHNIMNVGADLSLRYGLLDESLKDHKINNEFVLKDLNYLGEGITTFNTNYSIYKTYLVNVEFKIEKFNVKTMFNIELNKILQIQVPVYKKLKNNDRIKILIEDVKNDASILCDRIQFFHVILNIVKNAFEANATFVTIRFIEKDTTNEYSVTEIQDNGHGISKENKSKIFTEFTSKPYGTGMGLPVCSQVIKSHGGKINFRSLYQNKKKSGTVFAIYLPLKNINV